MLGANNSLSLSLLHHFENKWHPQSTIEKLYFRFQTWEGQHVSKKHLLTGLKFQVKIQRHSEACVQRGGQLSSKEEGLRQIEHNMSVVLGTRTQGNLFLKVNSVTVSYLVHYDTLLQNATDIIAICDSCFITK